MLGQLRRHPWWAVILLTLGIVLFLAATRLMPAQHGPGGPRGGATPVVVGTARYVDLSDRISAIGTARANESVLLTARVTESVRKVNFTDGMMVDKGAILIELTNAEESAQLAEAQATLAEARKQYQRITGLVKKGNASRSRLDEQTAVQDGARARVKAIAARLADRLVRAPFAGVLGFRNVSPGGLVVPGTSITTLDDISIIKLDFSVPERFLAALTPGLRIAAKSAAYPNRVFDGTVATINSRVDPNTRAVTVRAEILNTDNALRPGMLLTVELIRELERILVVPEAALVPVQDRQYVFVVSDSDVADRVAVEIGRRQPGLVEIINGLEDGQRVIVEGTIKARPGGKVRVVKDTGRTKE